MLLCDVIRQLEDESILTETVLRMGNLGLLTRLRERAAENDLSIGRYASWAVRTYADNAPPDEWMTLLGVLGRTDDPGAACLRRVLAHVLTAEGAPEGIAR